MAAPTPPTASAAPSTRQWLTKRQSATVDALLDAGLEVLREVGFAELSLRDVATRAQVTHTTAYNYFTSKEHLVAELNWRLLQANPATEPDPDEPVRERVASALRQASELFTDEPALAQALLAALSTDDPEITRIRSAIGAEMLRRIELAAGADADPRLVDGAFLLFSGAMLQAGLGHFSFDDALDRITATLELWTDA